MSIDIVINFLITYHLPAIFFGAFFFGETVILMAAFFAARGYWSLSTVILLAFLGTILADSIWFWFGDSIRKFFRRQRVRPSRQRILASIDRLLGKNAFLVLLFIKFLYGTRILTILYLAHRGIRFRLFLLFNTIGTLLWLAVIVPLGWFAGRGLGTVLPQFQRIDYALSALFILFLLFRAIELWYEKRIQSK